MNRFVRLRAALLDQPGRVVMSEHGDRISVEDEGGRGEVSVVLVGGDRDDDGDGGEGEGGDEGGGGGGGGGGGEGEEEYDVPGTFHA